MEGKPNKNLLVDSNPSDPAESLTESEPFEQIELSEAKNDIKKKRWDRMRKKDEKYLEMFIKTLACLAPEEKITALCKKNADFLEEIRKLQNSVKTLERRNVVLEKEKELLQTDQSKGVVNRARLESICRELQKQNKLIKEESLVKVREEEERRREVSTKFQTTLNEVTSMMQQNSDKNLKLRDDNIEITARFQNICEQFKLREDEVLRMTKQMELERKLADANLKRSQLELESERYEKGVWKQEKEDLLMRLRAATDEKQHLEMSIKSLEDHLNMYSDKYHQFETTLSRSNEIFQGYKTELGSMNSQISKLEKDCTLWKERWVTTSQSVNRLLGENQSLENDLKSTEKKVDQLTSLCRFLQDERGLFLKQLKDNGIKPAVVKCDNPTTPVIKPLSNTEKESLRSLNLEETEIANTELKSEDSSAAMQDPESEGLSIVKHEPNTENSSVITQKPKSEDSSAILQEPKTDETVFIKQKPKDAKIVIIEDKIKHDVTVVTLEQKDKETKLVEVKPEESETVEVMSEEPSTAEVLSEKSKIVDVKFKVPKIAVVKSEGSKITDIKFKVPKPVKIQPESYITPELMSEEPTTAEVLADESKTVEVKSKELKTTQVKTKKSKPVDIKFEKPKAAEAKSRESKTAEMKSEKSKRAEVKSKKYRTAEGKSEESKTADVMSEEYETVEVKSEESNFAKVELKKDLKTIDMKSVTAEINSEKPKITEMKSEEHISFKVASDELKTDDNNSVESKITEVLSEESKITEVISEEFKSSEIKSEKCKTAKAKLEEPKFVKEKSEVRKSVKEKLEEYKTVKSKSEKKESSGKQELKLQDGNQNFDDNSEDQKSYDPETEVIKIKMIFPNKFENKDSNTAILDKFVVSKSVDKKEYKTYSTVKPSEVLKYTEPKKVLSFPNKGYAMTKEERELKKLRDDIINLQVQITHAVQLEAEQKAKKGETEPLKIEPARTNRRRTNRGRKGNKNPESNKGDKNKLESCKHTGPTYTTPKSELVVMTTGSKGAVTSNLIIDQPQISPLDCGAKVDDVEVPADSRDVLSIGEFDIEEISVEPIDIKDLSKWADPDNPDVYASNLSLDDLGLESILEDLVISDSDEDTNLDNVEPTDFFSKPEELPNVELKETKTEDTITEDQKMFVSVSQKIIDVGLGMIADIATANQKDVTDVKKDKGNQKGSKRKTGKGQKARK